MTGASAQDRDLGALRDIGDFCDQAARLVTRGRDAYDADELLRLAGEAIVHRVGEGVARLSPGIQSSYPEIPWRAIKGMRNLVAHEYGRIDHIIVWNALERDLPQLRRQVAEIVADLDRR